MSVQLPKDFPLMTRTRLASFWHVQPEARECMLRDLSVAWVLTYWLHALGEHVGLDTACGVTWTYSPATSHGSVAAWVLCDSYGKQFWATDWLPAFEGLPRPRWPEGRVAVACLPPDPAEALHATLLEVCR